MTELFAITYALLWLLVSVLVATQFVLFRHLGQQLLNAPERKASQGPEIGSKIPAVRLLSLAGRVLTLGGELERPAFVFVASTVCEPCAASRDALARFSRRYAVEIQTILLCRGRTEADVRDFTTQLPTTVEVVSDRGSDFGTRLKVSHTPFAFIVDQHSIVRGKGSPDGDLAFDWFHQQLMIANGELEPTISIVGER